MTGVTYQKDGHKGRDQQQRQKQRRQQQHQLAVNFKTPWGTLTLRKTVEKDTEVIGSKQT